MQAHFLMKIGESFFQMVKNYQNVAKNILSTNICEKIRKILGKKIKGLVRGTRNLAYRNLRFRFEKSQKTTILFASFPQSV